MIVSEGTFFSWRCFPPSEGSFTSSFRLLLLTFRCPDSILHSNPLHPAGDGAVSELQVLHKLRGSGGGRSGGGCSAGRSQGPGCCHLHLKGSSVCPCQLIKSASGVAEGPADAVKAPKSVGGGVPDHCSLTSQVVHNFQGTIMEANSTRETLDVSICLSPGGQIWTRDKVNARA